MITHILLLLLSISIPSTHLYGSAGQSATAEKPVSNTQVTPMPLPPYRVGKGPHSLFFLKDGSLLGIGNLRENPVTVTVFAVNRDTGTLKEIEGSPFELSKSPVKPSNTKSPDSDYSPNEKWQALVTTRRYSNLRKVDLEDLDPFLLMTNNTPIAIPEFGSSYSPKFSPDSRLLAIATHPADCPQAMGFLFMYEIDQETGKASPITGDLLKVVRSEKEYQEAHKALVEPTPQILDQDSASVLKEYVVGPCPQEKSKKEPKK